MGTTNQGNLQLVGLQALSNPPGTTVPVTITFSTPSTYTRSDIAGTFTYTPGQPITYDNATPPTGWSLTVTGTPHVGDTITLDDSLSPAYGDWYKRDAGNARSMMNLRDVPMFD